MGEFKIKIEKHFTHDIKKLRQDSYSDYNWDGIDDVDKISSSNKWYINAYENDKLAGTIRVMKGILPLEAHYSTADLNNYVIQKNDFEIGRLALVGHNPLKKYHILIAMVRKLAAICIIENCNKLFTSSRRNTILLYDTLIGFKVISQGKAYPPLDANIFVLAVDFQEEYNRRTSDMYNLSDEYIEATRQEMLEFVPTHKRKDLYPITASLA